MPVLECNSGTWLRAPLSPRYVGCGFRDEPTYSNLPRTVTPRSQPLRRVQVHGVAHGDRFKAQSCSEGGLSVLPCTSCLRTSQRRVHRAAESPPDGPHYALRHHRSRPAEYCPGGTPAKSKRPSGGSTMASNCVTIAASGRSLAGISNARRRHDTGTRASDNDSTDPRRPNRRPGDVDSGFAYRRHPRPPAPPVMPAGRSDGRLVRMFAACRRDWRHPPDNCGPFSHRKAVRSGDRASVVNSGGPSKGIGSRLHAQMNYCTTGRFFNRYAP